MTSQREATMEAVAALTALEDPCALGRVNPLLEDDISTNRVRQVIAFLAEVTLQIGGDKFQNVVSDDATEGLGWILRSCDQALAILEDIRYAERQKLREVSSN